MDLITNIVLKIQIFEKYSYCYIENYRFKGGFETGKKQTPTEEFP